ncbi:MAG: hypothetical protein JST29_06765 [Bacteroidetes bacterium]|nr:hypothetical protein [Bacteroidota bacterium]
MKTIITLFFSALFFSNTCLSQTKLDSIISLLHNQGSEVGIIIRNVQEAPINKDKGIYTLVAKSVNYELDELIKKFSKDTVIIKLIKVLSDTTKDYVANCILYEIVNNKELRSFYFDNITREVWIKERMLIDLAYWRNYYNNHYN